jgi:uncharacterized protein
VAKARGHHPLSELLLSAARSGSDLWEPSPDPTLLPSSSAWRESKAQRASRELRVAYGGGVVVIPPGSRYYVDSFGRTAIGWHGTYDPPRGMG